MRGSCLVKKITESAKDVLKNGDEIKAVIMNHIKEDNPIYLSMTRLAKDEDWQYVIAAQEKQDTGDKVFRKEFLSTFFLQK